jgi:hypothetical protein
MVSDNAIFELVKQSTFLSDGSKTAYSKQLQSAQKALQGKPLKTILLHPLAIESLDAPLATRVAYTNALNSLFKREKEKGSSLLDFVSPEVRSEWADLLKRLHVERSARVDLNQRSEREKANWVSREEWVKEDERLRSTEQGSQTQLLVAFSTQIPPLRGGDLARVHLCQHGEECTRGNSLSLKPPRLTIREHKTRSTFGPIRVDLPPILVDDVAASLRLQPREYLFTTSKNEEYPTRDAFMVWKTNALQRVFKRHVTSNIARRAFVTDESTGSLAQLKRDAAAMGHSLEMHLAYRVIEPTAAKRQRSDPIHGGMALKAVYEMRNFVALPNSCTRIATKVLSVYYKALAKVVPVITGPWWFFTDEPERPSLKSLYESCLPGYISGKAVDMRPMIPLFKEEFEGKPYWEDQSIPRFTKKEDLNAYNWSNRNYDELHAILCDAQKYHRGGLISLNFIMNDQSVERHAVAYVGDPVLDSISFFDPLQKAEDSEETVEIDAKRDFHLNMKDVGKDMKQIIEVLSRQGGQQYIGDTLKLYKEHPYIDEFISINKGVDKEAMEWNPRDIPDDVSRVAILQSRRSNLAMMKRNADKDYEPDPNEAPIHYQSLWHIIGSPDLPKAPPPPRQGGMGFKAAFEEAQRQSNNIAIEKYDCVRQSIRALSAYYPQLKPLNDEIAGISIEEMAGKTDDELAALMRKYFPGSPRIHTSTTQRGMWEDLEWAYKNYGGGLISMMPKDTGKSISPFNGLPMGHLMMYVKDPAREGQLTIFDPVQGKTHDFYKLLESDYAFDFSTFPKDSVQPIADKFNRDISSTISLRIQMDYEARKWRLPPPDELPPAPSPPPPPPQPPVPSRDLRSLPGSSRAHQMLLAARKGGSLSSYIYE